MKLRWLLLISLLIISTLPLVSSAPPVTIVPQFTEGLSIEFPAMIYHKQNGFYEFHFHIFNISNGRPMTSGVTCYIHFYNESGNHMYKGYDDNISNGFDYSFALDGKNFTKTGFYYYITQCNTSSLGGYLNHAFEVNPNGLEPSEQIITVFFIALFLLLMGLLVLLFIVGLGHSFNLDYDVIDLGWNWGLYFVMFGAFMFEKVYLADTNIDNIMPIILQVTGITHILIPALSLGISLLVGSLMKQKFNSGRLNQVMKRGWHYG